MFHSHKFSTALMTAKEVLNSIRSLSSLLPVYVLSHTAAWQEDFWAYQDPYSSWATPASPKQVNASHSLTAAARIRKATTRETESNIQKVPRSGDDSSSSSREWKWQKSAKRTKEGTQQFYYLKYFTVIECHASPNFQWKTNSIALSEKRQQIFKNSYNL